MTPETVPLWFQIFLAVEICVFVPAGTIWYCERLNAWFAERQTKKLQARWREELKNVELVTNDQLRLLQAIARAAEQKRLMRSDVRRIH